MSVRRGGITSALIDNTASANLAIGRLERIINEIIENIEVLSFEELMEIGEDIKTLSQDLVPVDTGLLKSTAYVEGDEEAGFVEVGYDKDGEALYAVFVHENLEAQHEQGEAKFLEKAIDQTIPDILQRIRQKLAGEFR